MLIAGRSLPVMQAQVLLADVGVTFSMSRTGNCFDNAVTESFFGTRDRENASNALPSRIEGRLGKPFSSMWSAFTTGGGDILR